MLGGSSGLKYMAYVRGHPGDFDSWAKNGAAGWSYADVLPYFSYNYQVRSYSPG
jgi:choline dehydrogenase